MTKWMIRNLGVAVIAAGSVLAGSAAIEAQQQAPPPVTQEAGKPALTNLNTADQAALEKLPGIGPATAKAIIEFREKNGGFKKVEELMNVKGVGEKTFLKLKDLVTIVPPKIVGR
jgi:comEA protein